MIELIRPDWPAPANVRAAITCRAGGVSLSPYASLNLGDHVGDDPLAVATNQQRLAVALSLPAEPLWLTQVHGCAVADLEDARRGCEADAAFADRPDRVCAVLTADCLPLLLCDQQGERICAVHAGWRGLASGVIEAALRRMGRPGSELLAWLGPAIGPERFEVGAEVREAFVAHADEAAIAFRPAEQGKWLADIYRLARQRLAAFGGVWRGLCGGR